MILFMEEENNTTLTISDKNIKSKIYTIRNLKVMLDSDLAQLYEVTTGNLNKAVKRNIERFPKDFMFQLLTEEYNSLRFQTGTFQWLQDVKYLPWAYSREGANMLSAVLRTNIAIDRSVH